MITKIIEELADNSIPLSNPLLKLKIVAKRIKNERLYTIVSKELEGYDPHDDLPDYRLASATSLATIHQGWNTFENEPIPYTIFEEKLRKLFTGFPLTEGIEALENIAKEDGNDTLAKLFGADFASYITSQARKMVSDLVFSNIRITAHKSQVLGILGRIRNKFLDLVLALESEFPNIDNMIKEPLTEDNEITIKTTQYMAQINITASGDGNIINTGSGNDFNITLNVNKNDIESFKESLRKIDVQEEEIDEISAIVQQEEYNVKEQKFGERTQNWIRKMIGKVLDGSWKIAIGTAGGVLAKIISSYYGIN